MAIFNGYVSLPEGNNTKKMNCDVTYELDIVWYSR